MGALKQLNSQQLKNFFQIEKEAHIPERILQIGEGNFIRGFIDWMVYVLNQKTDFQGKIVTLQSTPKGRTGPKLNQQDGLYTLIRRGIENGETVEHIDIIDSISRAINPYEEWEKMLGIATSENIEFLFSNTTEAGLKYKKEEYHQNRSPITFPGKVVALLHHRFVFFNSAAEKGWTIIPCELVEDNGEVLKEICNQIITDWDLGNDFREWLNTNCCFCNTLVDRIVPGYPQDDNQWFNRLGYSDKLLTMAEPYHLFVIEGDKDLPVKLPFQQAGLNVRFDAIKNYRDMKVKLLNAPHTILTTIGLQLGLETVKQAVEDPLLGAFIKQVMKDEIVTVLPASVKEKSISYIDDIMERFSNPFLHHYLTDISLNNFSKYHVRVMPIIAANTGHRDCLLFSLGALIVYYQNTENRKDENEVLEAFSELYAGDYRNELILQEFMEQQIFKDWLGYEDELPSLISKVLGYVNLIQENGMNKALKSFLKVGES
ncbi:tagaturonate reductase [Planococcus beigongshangi]|uniref:tagaturonate reductase n=1 Tax=Planococcus beigongshangi TaxID=2782536 RepID=UPI00193C4E9A|nr:tagaturonate reductase [Planococcus beigongshangi]